MAEAHDNTDQKAASEPTPEQSEPAGTPPAEEHTVRDAVAKAVGIAVEAGSMLAGHSGALVSAEGAVAEADTEGLIERIEGED